MARPGKNAKATHTARHEGNRCIRPQRGELPAQNGWQSIGSSLSHNERRVSDGSAYGVSSCITTMLVFTGKLLDCKT